MSVSRKSSYRSKNYPARIRQTFKVGFILKVEHDPARISQTFKVGFILKVGLDPA